MTDQPPFLADVADTVSPEMRAPYPGDLDLERRLRGLMRWNAMAMVVRANHELDGIGGHIASYASAAVLYEVGFNHVWRARTADHPGDQLFVQGHAAPGIYARAYLEGRLDEARLRNFRRELRPPGGLPSYPHPWLLPDFWQFPTVSMGLGPLTAISQARSHRYQAARGLLPASDARVWAMLGDGECDEPETLSGLSLAAREGLDNLVFVVNCNLQRLDGPVRGNGSIIGELSRLFAGAGWNVITARWGSTWDDLFARDVQGRLRARLAQVVDGQWQRWTGVDGATLRRELFDTPELAALVADWSDQRLAGLRRGGHDPLVVYNAYQAACQHRGAPSVVLACTVKGWGMGAWGEGLNITHQQKKLPYEALQHIRSRFAILLDDDEIVDAPFWRPPADAPEMEYLHARRAALGGFVPARTSTAPRLDCPPLAAFAEFLAGTQGRPASTTMAWVRMLGILLKDAAIGRLLVPIIPDEARTFGMDGLFRQLGIYAPGGQRYVPVDADKALYYREAADGQVLEEGINEAGALASFVAAGTAHATTGVPLLPVYTFYSMFGFQRVGDLIFLAGDARARGILAGATAGRTALNGEGLQHQDGHSPLLASTCPRVEVYDPATAGELAVILQMAVERLLHDQEDRVFYLTLSNESLPQPPLPEGAAEGVRAGLYRIAGDDGAPLRLVGSGPLLHEVLRAADLLRERFGLTSEIFSMPSPVRLHREARACERWNRLHPDQPTRRPLAARLLGGPAPVVWCSDMVAALADALGRWIPALHSLGTEGLGRSSSRPELRRHFGVDAASIAATALAALARAGTLDPGQAARGVRDLGLDPDAADPMEV